jgi:aldose 1-epimerase
MQIKSKLYGKTGNNREITLYSISNNNNISFQVINYGGIITSLYVPDKNGNMDDIVLGFNTLEDYIASNPYFGALIGRYGNRIAKGRFKLNGIEYKLATNNFGNHLHGGDFGYDKVIWNALEINNKDEAGIMLTYLSKDGEEGYPGNLNIKVSYILNNNNELKILYEAKTDKTTIVNLTHHSYFNLRGEDNEDILNHELMINADRITAIDKTLIPTGELLQVKGTAFDFTSAKTIGSRIKEIDGGYDHNYILNKSGNELSLAARVYEPISGRIMEVFTTEPAMQFYSGNFLDGSLKGKSGNYYKKHQGFCLEAQHYPDSPNHPEFPSTVLNPGETYNQLTIYKFSV